MKFKKKVLIAYEVTLEDLLLDNIWDILFFSVSARVLPHIWLSDYTYTLAQRLVQLCV